jgi:large subunit ribosomal protein L6
MSRIGKLPVNLPAGVTVTVSPDNVVSVKGPLGTLSQMVDSDIKVEVGTHTEVHTGKEVPAVLVSRPTNQPRHRSLHGLYRALINNMVVGTTKGFEKKLEINGTGYRAQKNGNKLVLNVGYSHPVEFEEGDGITFDVPAPNRITVQGIDKQKVGQIAADVRAVREPEPYKGKGIKYDYEVIIRKEGKTGK